MFVSATTTEGPRDCSDAVEWAVTVEPCATVPAYPGQENEWQTDAAAAATTGHTAADDGVPDTTNTVTTKAVVVSLPDATFFIPTR